MKPANYCPRFHTLMLMATLAGAVNTTGLCIAQEASKAQKEEYLPLQSVEKVLLDLTNKNTTTLQKDKIKEQFADKTGKMYEGEITVSDVNALPDGIVISVKFDDRVEHRPADMLFKVQDEKGKKTAEEIGK